MISGGSGGYLLNQPLMLTPGEVINIVIGIGGAPNQTGGTTHFGSYLTCTGGYASMTGPPPGGNCGAFGGFGTRGNHITVPPDYGGGSAVSSPPLGYGQGGESSPCSGCSGSLGYGDKAHVGRGLSGDK